MVAAVFAASPLLLPDLSTRLGVPVGLTGLFSTVQVGSFAVASFLAGRLFRPRRRFHYAGLGLVAASSVAAALVTSFPLLLATRVVSGLGLGALTWIAWADATRFPRGIGEVAAVGPVTAMVASPAIGWLVERGGYPWVFAALGVLATVALFLPVDFADLPRVGRRVSGSRSNRVVLAALLLLTTGGSAVFIFAGATGVALHGLAPTTVAWALSLNALAGVAATRMEAGRGRAGLWLSGTAVSVLALGTLSAPGVFFVVMAVWGFVFWMGLPAVFRLLAERSLVPSERIGDAQALMAVGRVIGPTIGGLALGVGEFARLSVVGAVVLTLSSLTVAVVEKARAGQGAAPGTVR